MSITNSGNIINLLRPGLQQIVASAPNKPAFYSKVFNRRKSDKNFEIDVEIAMPGLGREKPEGTEVAYDMMRQTYTTTYVNRAYALGFIITREAIDDNLYKKQFPGQAEALKNSMAQLKDVNAASVFNNSFDSNFPIGDGLPLISTAHPLANGTTQSNGVAVQVGLNETAVTDFITQARKMRAASGLFDSVMPEQMVVPVELEFNARRLLDSAYRPATANNDIGVINDAGYLPKGYVSSEYLTSSTAWWVKTNALDGLTFYDRTPLEIDLEEDNSLKAIKTIAYERYSFGVTNFRALMGSQGTA